MNDRPVFHLGLGIDVSTPMQLDAQLEGAHDRRSVHNHSAHFENLAKTSNPLSFARATTTALQLVCIVLYQAEDEWI